MKRITILLSCILILFFSACDLNKLSSDSNSNQQSDSLTVSFIDVGQGDSTLIECQGEAMLIDAGLYGSRQNIINYLNQRDVETLTYCVATHPHSDHIGGMSDVIYNFNVETLVYPETDSSNLNSVLDACDEKGVDFYVPDVADTFTLGGAEITVLSPAKGTNHDNLNNTSIVLKLTYEDVSFMFTGDAEKEIERELLNSSFDLSADVLKCGHHGSSTSSSADFLKAVSPSVAVISCGKGNDYGHPHREVVNELKKQNIQSYRTDKCSTIVAQSDGKEINFFTANSSEATQSDGETPFFEYIGNQSSHVFHRYDCASAKDMKGKNKVYFLTRNEAEFWGYKPCSSCNP